MRESQDTQRTEVTSLTTNPGTLAVFRAARKTSLPATRDSLMRRSHSSHSPAPDVDGPLDVDIYDISLIYTQDGIIKVSNNAKIDAFSRMQVRVTAIDNK